MYEVYENYDQLKATKPKLANELVDEFGAGHWQQEELFVYDTLIDLAIYEVFDGWYGSLEIERDYNGAPNLINFINYEKLGSALRESWDSTLHYLSEDGSVATTCHGW